MRYIECLNAIVQNYYDVEPEFDDDPITVRFEGGLGWLVGVQLFDMDGVPTEFVEIGLIAPTDDGWEVADQISRGGVSLY